VLFGHEGDVLCIAFSPDGRWLATGDWDGIIRIWPIPEGKPLHTLPYEELLDRLRAQTNLRVTGNREDGYKIKPTGRFPGWAELPEW
jgi:WD40 repeat protein